MKNKIFSIIALLGAMTVASCGDNWEPNVGGGEGMGKMSMSDINVVNGETIKKDKSRADISTDNFIVEVEDANGQQVGQWIYGQMPELIDLPTGTGYRVNVKSHEQQPQAWDMPYYEGASDAFDIENNKITSIGTVTARFSNIAVTINYTNDMKLAMGDDSKVTVIANKNGQLEFAPTETRTGYFQALAESPTLVATFSGTINGVAVELTKIYKDVVAGNHYYITFGFKGPDPTVPDETGGIYVDESGITIDMTVDNNDVPGDVKVDEEKQDDSDRPGKEDPKDPVDPDDPIVPDDPTPDSIKFTSPTINLEEGAVNDPNSPELAESSIVYIESEEGVEHLWVHISSDSEDFKASAGNMVPFDFDLANPIVNGVDWSDALGAQGLKFPVKEEVIGQKNLEFNITEFVPLLGGFPGEHKFTIEVTDLKGAKKAITLIFVSK